MAAAQIFDLEFVLAIASGVGGIGEQIPIVAGNKRANIEELETLRKFILIQHQLFLSVKAAFLPVVDRILFTLLGMRVVKVIAPAIRHAVVRLLNVPHHFVI